MKLREFEAHLRRHGCEILREGGGHTIYQSATNGAVAAVPRHNEIKLGTARRICDTLDIPRPPFR